MKRILQFSLDNEWNDLNHTRVQPPISLGLEVRFQLLSTEKNNNPLRIIVSQDVLQKCANLVLQNILTILEIGISKKIIRKTSYILTGKLH